MVTLMPIEAPPKAHTRGAKAGDFCSYCDDAGKILVGGPYWRFVYQEADGVLITLGDGMRRRRAPCPICDGTKCVRLPQSGA